MQSFIECGVWVLYFLSYISCAQIPVLSPSEVFLINALSSQSLKANNDQLLQDASKRKRKSLVNNTISLKPEIHYFRVQSDIRYRYSRTQFTSKVVNQNETHSQEVIFSVILPETAFISKFVMEMDGINYKAFVKERDEGKKIYSTAQRKGQSAGLVELTARYSNVFNVNINIKPNSKVTFNLMYEDLLRRKLGRYEQIININPIQVSNVRDLQMVVNIHESQNITFLRMISFPNDNEAEDEAQEDNKDAVIARPVGNKAHISWSPSIEEQSGSDSVPQGIPEKFVLQYDINVDSNAGQVLIMDDHFVHFFAPTKLRAVAKHVILVLDVSGSMKGRKIEQLKESQKEILMDLSREDFFNIITFASEAFLWSPREIPQYEENSPWSTLETESFIRNQPIPATLENIQKAIDFIDALYPIGGTNIYSALETALNLTKVIKEFKSAPKSPSPSHSTVLPNGVESLIIILTDGMPTAGIESQTKIQSLIDVANRHLTVPIFSMVFGKRTDFHFLRRLSLQNNGFARKIYESPDASLQIKEVFNEISSLLLCNITFHYTSSQGTISDVTSTKFPTYFNGTEIVVAGKFTPKENYNPARKHILNVSIEGSGKDGLLRFSNPETLCEKNVRENFSVHDWMPRPESRVAKTDRFFERLWAYLTIKQLIDEDSIINIGLENSQNSAVKNESPKKQALRLAMQYSFVTPFTCLVVVKPNSSDLVAAPETIYVDKPGSGLIGRNLKSSRGQKNNDTKIPVEIENISESVKSSESMPGAKVTAPVTPKTPNNSGDKDNKTALPSVVPTLTDPLSSKEDNSSTETEDGSSEEDEDPLETTTTPVTSTISPKGNLITQLPATTTADNAPPKIQMKPTTDKNVGLPNITPVEEDIDRSNMMKVASANPATSKVATQHGGSIHGYYLTAFI